MAASFALPSFFALGDAVKDGASLHFSTLNETPLLSGL